MCLRANLLHQQERKEGTGIGNQNIKGRSSSPGAAFKHLSASLESPWIYILWFVAEECVWRANKERERVKGRE